MTDWCVFFLSGSVHTLGRARLCIINVWNITHIVCLHSLPVSVAVQVFKYKYAVFNRYGRMCYFSRMWFWPRKSERVISRANCSKEGVRVYLQNNVMFSWTWESTVSWFWSKKSGEVIIVLVVLFISLQLLFCVCVCVLLRYRGGVRHRSKIVRSLCNAIVSWECCVCC